MVREAKKTMLLLSEIDPFLTFIFQKQVTIKFLEVLRGILLQSRVYGRGEHFFWEIPFLEI